tara:strand:+ start:1332 stop:1667 length:336 start_codon:yes stop_codon:yes gene_type:complete
MDNQQQYTDDELRKRQARREYMREYKRKQYQKNREEMKSKNKEYYNKYKYGNTNEEHKKYGKHIKNANILKENLEILREENMEILEELLLPYYPYIQQKIKRDVNRAKVLV